MGRRVLFILGNSFVKLAQDFVRASQVVAGAVRPRRIGGVKLVALDFGDAVTAVARVVPEDERVDGADGAEGEGDAADDAGGEEQIEISPES